MNTDRTRHKLELSDRNAAVTAMYMQGCTLAQVGEKFGITRERARQIVSRDGVSRIDGGQSVRMAAKAAKEANLLDAKSLRKHGCDYATYRAILAAKGTRPYAQQRNSAGWRGIAWELSLLEWWSIWQRSGKWGQRGRGHGKYVMSRIKDNGPYAVGNVHIQLADENSRDAVASWKGAPPKKFKGVFHIYPGRVRGWRATIHGKSIGYFESAEAAAEARLWAQMRSEVEGLCDDMLAAA